VHVVGFALADGGRAEAEEAHVAAVIVPSDRAVFASTLAGA